MHQVRMLALAFTYYHDLDMEKGRSLLLYCAHIFLDTINSDQDLRPYLQNYPFVYKNIEIAIFLRSTDRNLPTSFSWIKLVDDKIKYYQKDPLSGQYNKVHEETVEEALRFTTVHSCNTIPCSLSVQRCISSGSTARDTPRL